MKFKLLLSPVLILSMVFIGFNANSQHHHKHPHAHPHPHPHPQKKVVRKAIAHQNHKGRMLHAQKVLRRTNRAIVHANNQVKKNKVYTGSLSRAVHHQRLAKRLLRNQKANRAMQHSRIARKHAFVAIRKNKGEVEERWEVSDDEREAMGENVSDEELEKELEGSDPTISFDDEKITDDDISDIEVLEMDPSEYKNE